jgi:hypothetical protein
MNISVAALARIPVLISPRKPTANAKAYAERGTPGAVMGKAWPGPVGHLGGEDSLIGPAARGASWCVVM